VDLPRSRRIEPVRQSPRLRTEGFFTKGTCPCHLPCSSVFLFLSDCLANRLPQPTRLPVTRSQGFHPACGTIRLSDCSFGIASHFAVAYRVAYPAATQKPQELSRGHVPVFRTVPSAHTLVRRVDGNAFASTVQARPFPVFGRPVRLRGIPLDYGPVLLLKPFGFHLTVDTLSSPIFIGAGEALPPPLDMALSIREPEGLQPS